MNSIINGSFYKKMVKLLRQRSARLAIVSLIILLGAGLMMPRELTQAAIGAVASPLAMLDDRGPGNRTGTLVTTKPPKAFLARVPSATPPAGSKPVADPAAPAAYLAQVPTGAPQSEQGPVLPLGTGSPDIGGVLPAPIDGGPVSSSLSPPQASINPLGSNPNSLPNSPPSPPQSPSGAVPELSTWAMMIIGLFGIGIMLRRQSLRGSRKGTAFA